jgi:hypothetical protein
LENEPLGNFSGEMIGGERLYAMAVDYLAETDTMKMVSAQTYDAIDCGYLGEAIAFLPMRVLSPLGAPQVRYEGAGIDVDLSLEIVSDRGGESEGESLQNFMISIGAFGSAMESELFERLLPLDTSEEAAISTVVILKEAALQGIPIYTVTPDNKTVTIPQLQLPSEIIKDIQNSAASGRHITVPKTMVTIGDYTGIGYVVMDPVSGAASYLIAGGLSGGYSKSAALDRLGMLANGNWDGFVDSMARGVKAMIKNRPLEFVGVPLAKAIILLVMAAVFPPLAAAWGIGTLTGVLIKIVVVNLVGEIIAAAARL